MKLFPLLPSASETAPSSSDGATANGLHRRFARLLEATLALFITPSESQTISTAPDSSVPSFETTLQEFTTTQSDTPSISKSERSERRADAPASTFGPSIPTNLHTPLPPLPQETIADAPLSATSSEPTSAPLQEAPSHLPTSSEPLLPEVLNEQKADFAEVPDHSPLPPTSQTSNQPTSPTPIHASQSSHSRTDSETHTPIATPDDSLQVTDAPLKQTPLTTQPDSQEATDTHLPAATDRQAPAAPDATPHARPVFSTGSNAPTNAHQTLAAQSAPDTVTSAEDAYPSSNETSPSTSNASTTRPPTATSSQPPAQPSPSPIPETARTASPPLSSSHPSLATAQQVAENDPEKQATTRTDQPAFVRKTTAAPDATPHARPVFSTGSNAPTNAHQTLAAQSAPDTVTPSEDAQPPSNPPTTQTPTATSSQPPAQPSPSPIPETARIEDPFLKDGDLDRSPDVQLSLAQIDRPETSSSQHLPLPAQSRALPQAIRTATWFQTALAYAERIRQHFDGQMLEVELANGEGTLRVETRREPDHVAVSVHLTDPQLRALVAAHADRIQEALQAQYQTAVQFSLSGGGDQGSQRQAFTRASTHGTPLASGSDASAPSPTGSARSRILRPGSRHEWIG